VKIADRYKNEPTVAAYDLLNEPLPEGTGAAAKYKDMLVPLYQRLINAMRKVDQKHMFTLEGYNWANNWSVFTKSPDKNTVYQFHYYCWNNPDNLNDISQYITRQKDLKAPIWVGETGERNNGIYFATSQYLEKHNMGWSVLALEEDGYGEYALLHEIACRMGSDYRLFKRGRTQCKNQCGRDIQGIA